MALVKDVVFIDGEQPMRRRRNSGSLSGSRSRAHTAYKAETNFVDVGASLTSSSVKNDPLRVTRSVELLRPFARYVEPRHVGTVIDHAVIRLARRMARATPNSRPFRAVAAVPVETHIRQIMPTVLPPSTYSWCRRSRFSWIGDAHLADQLANFGWSPRSTTSGSRSPAPVSAKAGAMPADHGLGFDDLQYLEDVRRQRVKTSEHHPVDTRESNTARRLAAEHV